MNLTGIGGVLPMYGVSGLIDARPEIEREKRGGPARCDESVQEWVLFHPGSEAGAVQRSDEARDVAALDVHREWEALVAENAPLAFRVARGVLRNDADAEEVAQEALLRAYQRFGRLRERARFRAWLVRISFRLALDRLRSAKRRQQREAQWVFENARTSSSAAEGAEFRRHLETALIELPKKQRLVLILAAMEGHSLEEVSALLGVPLGTVKSGCFLRKRHWQRG